MSLTATAWLIGLAVLLALSFKRPVYALGVYFYIFFMFPDFWWWGKSSGLAGHRWSFISGWWALALVAVHSAHMGRSLIVVRSPVDLAVVGIVVNATLVHLFLAPSWFVSLPAYLLVAKFCLLYFLIRASVWERADLLRLCVIILLCAGYIGYEATVNDRGNLVHGRLEGIGAPGARGANQLANLMIAVLPIAGTCVLQGNTAIRLAAVALCPMILNVVLLANSRGAFLGAILSALVFLPACPRRARRYAFLGLLTGAGALVILLRDPEIVERFKTTFAGSEERDNSAAERLLLWRAGLEMLADYPLGSGGYGFKRVRGKYYVADVGLHYDVRSVHNGYINEACEWGIQGLALKLTMLVGAAAVAWRSSRRVAAAGFVKGGLLGAAIVAGIVGFMVSATFGDFLDSEWGYWLAALALSYRDQFMPAANGSRTPGELMQTHASATKRRRTLGRPQQAAPSIPFLSQLHSRTSVGGCRLDFCHLWAPASRLGQWPSGTYVRPRLASVTENAPRQHTMGKTTNPAVTDSRARALLRRAAHQILDACRRISLMSRRFERLLFGPPVSGEGRTLG